MARQHKKKKSRFKSYTKDRSPCLSSAITTCGNYVRTYLPFIRFIGESNERFLTGIIDHCDHVGKNGEVFFSGPLFEDKYRVSRPRQARAIKALSKGVLLKQLKKRGPRNTRYIRINETASFIFAMMVNRIENKRDLPKLWKMIMKDKKLRRLIKGRIKRIKKNWRNVTLKYGVKRLPKKVINDCEEFTSMICDYFYGDDE